MNAYDQAAYAALHEVTNKLSALLMNNFSASHPLSLDERVTTLMGEARQALFEAQRILEREIVR